MRYTSDLTDAEWQLIHYCFPKPARRGDRASTLTGNCSTRSSISCKTGLPMAQSAQALCALGHGLSLLPPVETHRTVGGDSWHLREHLRPVDGRQRQASAGIIDSQSVKSTECSDERGYDAGKKINGRKRHLLVDTMGLILLVLVLPANIQDRDAARQLLDDVLWPDIAATRQTHLGRWRLRRSAGGLGLKLWRCTVEIVKRTETCTLSRCCRAAGSWSAPSAGWAVTAGSIGTTNAKPKRGKSSSMWP